MVGRLPRRTALGGHCVWRITGSARFTRRRKEAYEALHPETKVGSLNQHTAGRKVCDEHTPRFTADTATKTGQSERVIQRDDQRGKNIDQEVLTQIAGTKLDTGKTLDELTSVPKEEQKARVIKIAERRVSKPAPIPANDVETEEQWKTAFMREAASLCY